MKNISFSEAKQTKEFLEKSVKNAEEILHKIPGVNKSGGLTPDAIKTSTDFQKAKQNFNVAFSKLRDFNGFFVKQFKKEIGEERKLRRV